jgi:hypothetical protein
MYRRPKIFLHLKHAPKNLTYCQWLLQEVMFVTNKRVKLPNEIETVCKDINGKYIQLNVVIENFLGSR